MNRELKELIGEKIKAVYLKDDCQTIVFEVEDGRALGYMAEGDCSSQSYFNDFGPVAVIGEGARVIEIKDRDVSNRNTDNDRDDVTEFYGHTIVTTKGYLDLVYRNESNGYYSGSLKYCGDDWNISSLGSSFKKLTEDLSN